LRPSARHRSAPRRGPIRSSPFILGAGILTSFPFPPGWFTMGS
jgi:hypothetical protein